jgi:pimeloyl-ACP methyl ester carboxylesterase
VREFGWLPNTEEFTALRLQRLSAEHPLGALPLRVLERARDSTDVWHNQQVELARLSSAGKLIRAEGSGHMIHLERPDLVTQAIREVIREVRPGK